MYKKILPFLLTPVLALLFLSNSCSGQKKMLKVLTSTTWKVSSEDKPAGLTYWRSPSHTFQPSRGIRDTYVFKEDHSFVMEYSGMTDVPQKSKGTWSIDNDLLTLKLHDGERANTSVTYKVLDASPELIKLKRQ